MKLSLFCWSVWVQLPTKGHKLFERSLEFESRLVSFCGILCLNNKGLGALQSLSICGSQCILFQLNLWSSPYSKKAPVTTYYIPRDWNVSQMVSGDPWIIETRTRIKINWIISWIIEYSICYHWYYFYPELCTCFVFSWLCFYRQQHCTVLHGISFRCFCRSWKNP